VTAAVGAANTVDTVVAEQEPAVGIVVDIEEGVAVVEHVVTEAGDRTLGLRIEDYWTWNQSMSVVVDVREGRWGFVVVTEHMIGVVVSRVVGEVCWVVVVVVAVVAVAVEVADIESMIEEVVGDKMEEDTPVVDGNPSTSCNNSQHRPWEQKEQ
jgi:hypothetical protein